MDALEVRFELVAIHGGQIGGGERSDGGHGETSENSMKILYQTGTVFQWETQRRGNGIIPSVPRLCSVIRF